MNNWVCEPLPQRILINFAMSQEFLFTIIILLITGQFILDLVLEFLNSSAGKEKMPEEVDGIYDESKYQKSIAYERENRHFSVLASAFNLLLILGMLFLQGFAIVDKFAREITNNEVLLPAVFFGMLMLASGIINIPFSLYRTFIIEERFGFNRTTIKTFISDRLKGVLLSVLIGGSLLILITWIYLLTTTWFWLLALSLITLFMIFMNFFYSSLIVPLFNKQTPLEEGILKKNIQDLANKTGFQIKNVFKINGSKRSSKANAYFSGFGKRKRIVLFDTLINELSVNEILAVLAHEIGHYKLKHLYKGLFISFTTTALTLYLLGLFIGKPELSLVLGIQEASFHSGLLVFGILYSPVSLLLGLMGNHLSRNHEFQADAFAAAHYSAEHLSEALKKLSVKNLSNLQPHPLYVFFNYSHPPLLQRLKALKKE
jgi:STE24 endopeptidase